MQMIYWPIELLSSSAYLNARKRFRLKIRQAVTSSPNHAELYKQRHKWAKKTFPP